MKRMFIVLVTLVTINLTMPLTQYATQTPGSGWFTRLPSLPSASAYLPTAETLQNITQQMTQNKAILGAALTGALGMGGYLAQKAYSSAKRIPYADEAAFIQWLAKTTEAAVYFQDPTDTQPSTPEDDPANPEMSTLQNLHKKKETPPNSLQNSPEFKQKMDELERIIIARSEIDTSKSDKEILASEKDLKATKEDLKKVFVDLCLLTLLPIIHKELKADIKPFETDIKPFEEKKSEPVKKN